MRPQPALGIPPEFLRRQPAHALDEGTLDLTEVERRVQRLADIVDDIGPLDLVFAGQRVDADLGARGAVGEVIERTPPPSARLQWIFGVL